MGAKKKKEIIALLGASALTDGGTGADAGFEAVCACDMMSDLLSTMNETGQPGGKAILLTSLANPQVVRTADMVDIQLVVLLRNKKPAVETIELARASGIALMSSPFSMYKCCGLLYGAGMRDVEEDR